MTPVLFPTKQTPPAQTGYRDECAHFAELKRRRLQARSRARRRWRLRALRSLLRMARRLPIRLSWPKTRDDAKI